MFFSIRLPQRGLGLALDGGGTRLVEPGKRRKKKATKQPSNHHQESYLATSQPRNLVTSHPFTDVQTLGKEVPQGSIRN